MIQVPRFPGASQELLRVSGPKVVLRAHGRRRTVSWGQRWQVGTAAQWVALTQCAELDGIAQDPGRHRLASTLREEMSACILGGFGMPFETGLAAFHAVRRAGLLKEKAAPSSDQIAYRTASGETIMTVSQFYLVADVAAFQASPFSKAHQKKVENLPETPWTIEDLAQIIVLPFEVPQALMDLCADRPDEWIGSSEVYERAGVTQKSGMGKMAGFGFSVRTRFERSNAPWNIDWAHGGVSQQYYRLDQETAQIWQEARAASQ